MQIGKNSSHIVTEVKFLDVCGHTIMDGSYLKQTKSCALVATLLYTFCMQHRT